MNFLSIFAFLVATFASTKANPVITSWIKSTGYNGYNKQLGDVQKVQYSTNYVYISSTSVAGTYTVGQPGFNTTYPWADCP